MHTLDMIHTWISVLDCLTNDAMFGTSSMEILVLSKDSSSAIPASRLLFAAINFAICTTSRYSAPNCCI